MLLEMLKSKIYRARVTGAALDYEGSIALCPELRQAAGLLLHEKVLVANVNNGARLETYVMAGEAGEVCLNGAAARLGEVGDVLVIMSFCHLAAKEAARHEPVKISVDAQNQLITA